VNVANIAGGLVIFGDPLAHGLAGSLIEAGAFAAICAGAFLTPVRAATQPRSGRHAPKVPAQPPEPAREAVAPACDAPLTFGRVDAPEEALVSRQRAARWELGR
jgi:hypothetical protein